MNGDTITFEELTEAIKNVSMVSAISQNGFARALFDYAVKHRDPEYIDQEAYVDADGDFYQYFPAFDDYPECWNAFGDRSSIAFDVPKRPLTRMVREVVG